MVEDLKNMNPKAKWANNFSFCFQKKKKSFYLFL